jgi:ZIP family zinc transporter
LTGLQTAATGAIAGGTILIGLPIVRLKVLGTRGRAFLASLSVGVLLFLFTDVVSKSGSVIDDTIVAGDGGRFAALAALFLLGLAIAPVVLARAAKPKAGDAVLRLGMLIAIAIGFHNLAEGLAIGVASRQGQVALAGTLVAGFALHNVTEGFGIVGPMGDHQPSWAWLLIAGVVAGSPTFFGSIIGYHMTAQPLQIAALGLAAGAIAYVMAEIGTAVIRRASRELVLIGALAGFIAGFATDWILVATGA